MQPVSSCLCLSPGARDMSVAVRKAGPEDFDAVCPLFEAFYREEGFPEAVSGVANNLRSILTRADTAAFVAEADTAAIGAAATSSAFGLEVGQYAEIEDIYVLPEHRGAGVARQLIEASFEWARSIGCHHIEIVITRHGREVGGLVPFYTKLGFEDADRMIMERTL